MLIAVERGDVPIVKIILAAGADPNGSRRKIRSPLMAAAAAGRPELVQMLLGKKALVNLRLESGETALKLSKAGKSPGHAECARILRKVGAK